jgi:hypothetical protein
LTPERLADSLIAWFAANFARVVAAVAPLHLLALTESPTSYGCICRPRIPWAFLLEAIFIQNLLENHLFPKWK